MVAGVFGLLVNVIVVKLLSPGEMGSFFLTHSMVTVFSLVAQLNLPQLIVRLTAEGLATGNMTRVKSDICFALIIACITCLITSSCLVLFAGDWLAIHVFNSPLITTAIGIASFWIVALTLQVIFVEVFRGLHDVKIASPFGGALTNFLLFVIVCLFWLYGDADAEPVLIALAIGKLVNICTGMRGYILMLTGLGRLLMKVTIFGGILNIIFCIVGVVHFGILGVAIGAASASILQCIFEMVAVRRQIGLWTHLSFIEFKGLVNEYKS